ncbi:L-ribulose-5-phosphate 4-epimerase [Lentibacillus kapialis]|uniref:L-ribulose-5-phosphate 4-epimerase n=1 Tax=Lentibacillus kapialis TaxID=340214 RepID=A0A917PTG0_9BACI|nr:L-ribulose-5-phosphate 4-epimerase [Lentibacillus kapialis]GGJ91010.1 L-ribulose-5-phosphate 4-epimerase [Lentibacillus kapialis]
MLDELKKEVLLANKSLSENGLVTLTWGNVSGIDKQSELVIIKPSGVPYEELTMENLSVVNLDGELVEGKKPSSDTPTHLLLYKRFPEIGGIVHTHSPYATSWAQAGRDIPVLGTTHADYFYGSIPCTRPMTETEIKDNYELKTGHVIVEAFKNRHYKETPGVLVHGHASFSWGSSAKEAINHTIVLEEVAKMGMWTEQLKGDVLSIDRALLDKHYFRKHGKYSYYGQN